MDVEKLIERYPTIYHMAEAASWPSIRQHGLLSASEVLRRAGSPSALHSAFRAEKVSVQVPEMGVVVLRDQKPMAAKRLEMALTDDTTPGEWYRLINDRVFLWAQEKRLLGLLNAKEYRHLEHDVLTVDTASLLAAHAERVSLCHMNSGNTFPIPHHRGRDAFRRIASYPTKKSGKPVKEVVELTVDDHVLDIAAHVLRVRRMRGATVLGELPLV
jgi:hypothetical protein